MTNPMSEILFLDQVVMRPVDQLAKNPRNARLHSESQIQEIRNSILEFGWTVPILIDENDVVLAGHGRLEAARRLEVEEVPTITVSHLTETQKKAYALADNKIALNSEWDEVLLAEELAALAEEGFDLALAGFSDYEPFPEPKEDTEPFKEYDETLDTEHRCPSCGYRWSGSSK